MVDCLKVLQKFKTGFLGQSEQPEIVIGEEFQTLKNYQKKFGNASGWGNVYILLDWSSIEGYWIEAGQENITRSNIYWLFKRISMLQVAEIPVNRMNYILIYFCSYFSGHTSTLWCFLSVCPLLSEKLYSKLLFPFLAVPQGTLCWAVRTYFWSHIFSRIRKLLADSVSCWFQNLMDVGGNPCSYLRKAISRPSEEQVQRPSAVNVLGVFEQHERNPCSWSRIIKGSAVKNEVT